MPYSPSAAGFIRNQLLDSTSSAGRGYWPTLIWCDGINHESQQDMQRRQEEGEILLFYQDDSWSRANFLRSCRGVVFCWVSCVLKYSSFSIYSGLRGSAILCSRGLHYARGFVFDPNLDIFWNQRDKVGTLFGNSVNSWSFIPIQKF